jgi:CubicO group peptidase (beta-lactamase class C family)
MCVHPGRAAAIDWRFVMTQFRFRRRALCMALSALGAVMVGCGQAPVQTGPDHVPDSNIALAAAKDGKYATMAWPLVDNVMNGWLDGPLAPGCAVGVSLDDQVVYLKGYGRSRLGIDARDWGVSTMGAIGSVSKTLTALGAMRQIERGWADFEDQVDQRLPIGGELGNAILFKLLSHTAGAGGNSRGQAFRPNWDAGSAFGQCTGAVTPDAGDPACTEAHRAALDPTALAAAFAANEANNVFELPSVDTDGDGHGDGWQAIYSNVGYQVAGGMVGAVAQAHGYNGYEDFIWSHVGRWSDNPLAPGQATSLAITHRHRANDIPERAVGYYDGNWGVGPKNWVQGDPWEVTHAQASWFGPSGGWAITIGDLTRLLAAYQSNKIVSAASRHWMELDIGHLALGPDSENFPPYGLGLLIDDNNGSVYHGGDIGLGGPGNSQQSTNSAVWSLWPNAVGSTDVGVAMMCNNGRGSSSLYSRAKDIVEALQASPQSRPVSTQTHSTQPSPSVVHQRTYRLDASRAHVLLPDGFPMLPAQVNPLTLQPDLGQRTLLVRHQNGSQPGATAGLLSNTRLDRGRLNAGSGSLQIAVGGSVLTTSARSLSFQVANDGNRLYDGRAEALVDARALVQLGVARNTTQVCDAVRAARSSCTPCADGAASCFVAAVGGLEAHRQ